MTQKYYVPIMVIVEIKNGYADNDNLDEIEKTLRQEIRFCLNEIDVISAAVQEILAGEAELVHLGVEEPIGM